MDCIYDHDHDAEPDECEFQTALARRDRHAGVERAVSAAHDLHCDCRIELLKVAEERDTARREVESLTEELRRSDLQCERERIKAARLRDELNGIKAAFNA
jgi:hypothetical protein